MKRILFAGLLSSALVLAATQSLLANEIWHIKCFNARGQTMAVKALGSDGLLLDVKALASVDAEYFDVKVLLPNDGGQLPVKVLPSPESQDYSDVKAIASDKDILGIKVVTAGGKILDVKAFYNASSGRYDIKCVGDGGRRLGLKAISPAGQTYDVKGLKDLPGQKDPGVEIEAHIKAVKPG